MTWTDGASQGAGAEDAMKACIGGDKPAEVETIEQMKTRILETPIESKTYDGTATACARIILEAYESWPELRAV